MKSKVNAKPKIDAQTITDFKNNADDARCFVLRKNKQTSILSGEIKEGTEIAFIPRFGVLTKSEFELFKKQFC